MNILISNDDGYGAEGLCALYEVASRYGSVAIVAPDRQHSMKSHAISGDVLTVVKDPGLAHAYHCTGTPADCVRLGLNHLPIGTVDVVIAGINHGGNLGVDVFYSGTLAAAREAALLGVPAIAMSQMCRGTATENWERARALAAEALEHVLGHRTPARLPRLTNINLPCFTVAETPHGIKQCPMTVAPMGMEFDEVEPLRFKYAASYFGRPAPQGSDVFYAMNGWITVTELNLDQN